MEKLNWYIKDKKGDCNMISELKVSELREKVSEAAFQETYSQFMEQAEKNAITKKSNGPITPYGFDTKKMDGKDFTMRFGFGAASTSPHLN
mgnify:FL=1